MPERQLYNRQRWRKEKITLNVLFAVLVGKFGLNIFGGPGTLEAEVHCQVAELQLPLTELLLKEGATNPCRFARSLLVTG